MKNRLRVLRAERNWTQAKLADELEVSRQTVNAIETGKYDPALPLSFKIACLFNLADEFLDGIDVTLIALQDDNAQFFNSYDVDVTL